VVISSWSSASCRAADGQLPSLPGCEPSPSAGQPAEIEGLSTTGASCPSSSRAIASHSAAASFGAGAADCPEPGMAAGMAAAISIASSGRACQVSLQREQRTVRPPDPRVAGLMA
jgi:hypothetical protein